jgi:hypothetical protein
MTREEITAWGEQNGWRVQAGVLCLTKPTAPKEAIVKLVFKATVVSLEVKKPAGKWESFSSAAYKDVVLDPEGGLPLGLKLEKIPSLSMLMQANKDAQVFAKFK